MNVQRRLWFGFGITFFFLVVLTLAVFNESKRVSQAEKWVSHTHQVIAVLETLVSEMKDAETGQRGYLLTSEANYLEPYDSALKYSKIELEKLASLTADNPNQQARIVQIRGLMASKFAELAQTIELHREGEIKEALTMVKTSAGKQVMDEFRVLVTKMNDEENRLLDQRVTTSHQTARASSWAIYGGSGLVFLIISGVAFLTSKSISTDYRRLMDAEKSLTAANQELQNFVYRTSHDFKSPLLGINSMARFVEEDIKAGNTDEALSNLMRIRKNCDSIITIVGSTLQLVKTDLANNHIQAVDLESMFLGAQQRMAGIAEERQVEIRTGDGVRGLTINSDSDQLLTIIENLISNSIKYYQTDRKNSFVLINAIGRDQGAVDITVEDNGVGFPEKYQSQVFGMFKQFHPERAEGTGLGLYIVKKSVERLNGTISYDSSKDGTRFLVNLPRLEVTVAKAKPPSI